MKATSRSRLGICFDVDGRDSRLCAVGGSGAACSKKSSLAAPAAGHPGRKAGDGTGRQRRQLAPKSAPLPQKRPPANAGLSAFAQANVGLHGALFESRATFKPLARPASGPFAIAPTRPPRLPISLRSNG